MRVLILEYDAILCDLIRLKLQTNGLVPVICRDPVYVRDELGDRQPDALVVDTCLPYQNGIDLLHELKDEKLLHDVYVVILSSLGFSCIVKQAVEAGADDFLVKPLNMDSLVTKLKLHQKVPEEELLLSADVMDS